MARILIADDSSIMRRNLKFILNSAGHEVVGESADGKQAILDFKVLKPDLVTMDITMPMLDGIEATGQIIRQYPEAKIIIISALDQKRKVFDALVNGAKHYIIKPFTKEKVLKIVDEVLIAESISNPLEIKVQHDETDHKIESKEPFDIENRQGTFVIIFNQAIDTQILDSLTMAIKGLLYIKPLKIVFNFDNLEEVDKMVLKKLNDLAQNIIDVGGKVEAICNKEYINKLGREYGNRIFQKNITNG